MFSRWKFPHFACRLSSHSYCRSAKFVARFRSHSQRDFAQLSSGSTIKFSWKIITLQKINSVNKWKLTTFDRLFAGCTVVDSGELVVRVWGAFILSVLHRCTFIALAQSLASLINIIDWLAIPIQWLVRTFRKTPAAIVSVLTKLGRFLEVHDHLINGQKLPGIGDSVTRAWTTFNRRVYATF